MRLSLLSIILLLSSCQSLPPAPKGDLCMLDPDHNSSICIPISEETAKQLQKTEYPKSVFLSMNGKNVPISSMHNWIAVSPDTWENLQIYINKLQVLAKQRCQ